MASKLFLFWCSQSILNRVIRYIILHFHSAQMYNNGLPLTTFRCVRFYLFKKKQKKWTKVILFLLNKFQFTNKLFITQSSTLCFKHNNLFYWIMWEVAYARIIIIIRVSLNNSNWVLVYRPGYISSVLGFARSISWGNQRLDRPLSLLLIGPNGVRFLHL